MGPTVRSVSLPAYPIRTGVGHRYLQTMIMMGGRTCLSQMVTTGTTPTVIFWSIKVIIIFNGQEWVRKLTLFIWWARWPQHPCITTLSRITAILPSPINQVTGDSVHLGFQVAALTPILIMMATLILSSTIKMRLHPFTKI